MITIRYGGFWRRAVALVIDKVILYLITLFLFSLLLLAVGLDLPPLGGSLSPDKISVLFRGAIGLYLVTATIANLCYFTYFHGNTGQTPGKMLMRLQVIQISGERMTFGLAFLRWVGYILSAIVFYLGFVWVAWDKKKQGWHDKIAGTIVIRLEPRRAETRNES